MSRTRTFIIFSILISLTVSEHCNSYTNCDTYECHEPSYNADILIGLEEEGPGFKEFHSSMQQAVDIMNSYGGTVSDDINILHMTLQYYCCYNLTQYEEIISVIQSLTWEPFDLKFSRAICNVGGDGESGFISLITLLDEKGQQQMEAFVSSIEQALENAGIPIHVPRSQQEPFHSTIGVVNATTPGDEIVDQINQQITVWNETPMRIDYFFLLTPPHVFHASNSTMPQPIRIGARPIKADKDF